MKKINRAAMLKDREILGVEGDLNAIAMGYEYRPCSCDECLR